MPMDPNPYLQTPVEEAVLLGRITQHVKDYGVLDPHGLWTLRPELDSIEEAYKHMETLAENGSLQRVDFGGHVAYRVREQQEAGQS
jgi:hypothetical protein